MSKRKLTAGQTSVSLPIFVQDTTSSTGAGLSGLTSATSGLVAEWRRRGGSSWTAITLTSKTLGTWTSGGFVADGSLGGAYEMDLPNAVCASGERWVAVRLYGAANMLPCLIEIELDAFDYQTASAAQTGDSFARLGAPAGASVSADIAAISSGTGSGARTVTITVNDGTTVLQNARVRLTEGANTFTALTNVSGVVTFNLDDATYAVSITKSGYSYAGTTLVVDGTETRTYSMTVVTVTPPDDPALCAVSIHVFDQYGADMSGQPVEITFVKWDTTATDTPPVLSVPPVQTTDANGLVSVNLFREAVYRIVYGNAPYTRRVDVTIPDAGTYTVEI